MNEELGKIKVEVTKAEVVNVRDDFEDSEFSSDVQPLTPNSQPSNPGDDAGEVAPPGQLELDLMSFLFDHEHDAMLGGMLGEFLPREVFEHEFTLRFLDNWKLELKSSDDVFATFVAALHPVERGWFDKVLEGSGKARTDSLSAADIMQDFVRRLWVRRLTRLRGELAADGDDGVLLKRMRMTTDIKRLDMIKWSAVKDFIREQSNGK